MVWLFMATNVFGLWESDYTGMMLDIFNFVAHVSFRFCEKMLGSV